MNQQVNKLKKVQCKFKRNLTLIKNHFKCINIKNLLKFIMRIIYKNIQFSFRIIACSTTEY